MVHDLLIPAPRPPRGLPPPTPTPTPETPPQVTVQVTPGPPPNPFTQLVLEDSGARGNQPVDGTAYPWLHGVPLSIAIDNNFDVAVTIQVHGWIASDTSRPLERPLLEVDVGPGGRVMESIAPEDGREGWAPYAWARSIPKSAPTRGNVRVSFSRPGV